MSARVVRLILLVYAAAASAFVFAPVASLVLFSFHAGRVQAFPLDSFSAAWYHVAFENPDIRGGIATSVKVGILVAVLSTALGFLSAHVLCRSTLKWRTLYVALVTVPCLIPLLLSGLALLMYFQRLQFHGSMWSIVAAHSCYCSPFALAIIRNAYDSLNIELEQAARNLGASAFQVTFEVALPQLWPAIASAAIICFLISWDEFILAWFVGGFTKTLPVVIYGMLGGSFNPSLNAVGTLVMLVSITLLCAALLFDSHVLRKRK